MSQKPRSDSKLKTLPDERQEEIAEYASRHSLAETVAWLREDGISVAPSTLSEFLRDYRLSRQFSVFEKSSLQMIELLRKKRPELPESELQGYASEFFQLQALQMNDPKTFLAFSTARFDAEMEKEKLRIKQEELALAKAKYQRETCELFLQWFEDKRAKEAAASGVSNAEKIERLGQLMFGEGWNR